MGESVTRLTLRASRSVAVGAFSPRSRYTTRLCDRRSSAPVAPYSSWFSAVRIAIIIDEFQHANAGTEHQLAVMLTALAQCASVEVLTFRQSAWTAENARRLGFETRTFRIDDFKSAYTYANLWRLVRYLRSARPDVVHTFFPVANIFGVGAAWAAGVPAVVASRRDYGEWMTPRYFRATRAANRCVDLIVTNAPRVRELTIRKEGVPEEKVVVVPNAIDVQRFRQRAGDGALKQRLGIPESAQVAGLVANYRPMKRQETLLRAARKLRESHPDLHFLFVGQNMTPEDIEGRLRRMTTELGLDERVHFAHADGDIEAYLEVIDIGVNCSEGEGLSNAIMEYMAVGIPCIAADSGGNPDLIAHERTGLLFPLGDHDALAAGLRRLVDDRDCAARLGSQAQAWLTATFSVETTVEQLLSFYRGLVRPSGRGVGVLQ